MMHPLEKTTHRLHVVALNLGWNNTASLRPVVLTLDSYGARTMVPTPVPIPADVWDDARPGDVIRAIQVRPDRPRAAQEVFRGLVFTAEAWVVYQPGPAELVRGGTTASERRQSVRTTLGMNTDDEWIQFVTHETNGQTGRLASWDNECDATRTLASSDILLAMRHLIGHIASHEPEGENA